MSTPRNALAYQLRVQFGLPPDRPTDAELNAIIHEVDAFRARKGRVPIKDEWRSVTLKHTGCDGSHFYKGVNFQDLNALLASIRVQAQAAQAQAQAPRDVTPTGWRTQVRQELKRFCSFPAGHPTDGEVDQIAADVVAHETATGKAAYQNDVERIAKSHIPGTRFIRFDGLNFQDINALLAMIRARALSPASR